MSRPIHPNKQLVGRDRDPRTTKKVRMNTAATVRDTKTWERAVSSYIEDNQLEKPPQGKTKNGELICLPLHALGPKFIVVLYVDGTTRVVHKNYFADR